MFLDGILHLKPTAGVRVRVRVRVGLG